MSILSKIILPELEKQLLQQSPEIISFIMKNTEHVAANLVKLIVNTIHGENHGREMDKQSNPQIT